MVDITGSTVATAAAVAVGSGARRGHGSPVRSARSSIPAQTHHVEVADRRSPPPAPAADHALHLPHPHPTSIMASPSIASAKPPLPHKASSHENLSHSLDPADILALLHCVYCNEQLTAPTTLRCGHTLCAEHVQLPPSTTSTTPPKPETATPPPPPPQQTQSASASTTALPACPLENCASDQSARAAAPIPLPTSSRVSYYPPPPVPASTSTSIASASTSSSSTEAGAGGSSSSRTASARGPTDEPPPPPPPSSQPAAQARVRVAAPKQDVIVSKLLQIAVQAQATRDARVRLAEAQRNMSSGKDSEGSGASDDDNEADDHDAERGGEDESVRRVRIPSPGAGLSSSSLGAGTAGSSSRSVVSRTSSQRSASPGAPSTTASLRRRRQPTSSPDVSDEQPHASAEGAGGGGAATRQSRPKAKKRKMRSELATHGSDTRGREGGCASSSSSDPRAGDDAAFAKALKSEVQCEICFAMLYAPVTTPCQHTFCGKCLSRTLDHSTQCPLCRQTLPGYAYFHEHATNRVVVSIMLKAFPRAVADRKASIEQEERSARLNTPLFVCQLAFPGLPTILHIFEPRYRLMIRRCLQNPTPAFGMMMPPRTNGNLNDYGTMLEILSVQMLPDGRSMVETKGIHRFRVLERGQLDGYGVGRVERIDDVDPAFDDLLAEVGAALLASQSTSSTSNSTAGDRNHSRSASTSELSSPPTCAPGASTSSLPLTATATSPSTPLPSLKEPTVDELMQVCRDFYDQLRSGTAPWVVQQLNNTYGVMPADPSTFSFWMAVLLPIDESEKAKLLPIRSPCMRLKLIVHWIQTLNGSWWFRSGCVVC